MTLPVDTSVWSLALRRDGPVDASEVIALREALDGAGSVVTTGLVFQELLQGFGGVKAKGAIYGAVCELIAQQIIPSERQGAR